MNWPPTLSEAQLQALTLLATTYALSHGLVYLPVAKAQPPAPTSTIHAPLALFPSPFPRRLFHLAQRLQRIYNVLYARIATDESFLDRVMGEVDGVGKVDEFTGQLWRRWRRLRDEGVVQVWLYHARRVVTVRDLRPTASATRSLSLGLSAACARQWGTDLAQAGGIQHNIVVVWGVVGAGCRSP